MFATKARPGPTYKTFQKGTRSLGMVFSERRRKLDPPNTEDHPLEESRPWGGTCVLHQFRTPWQSSSQLRGGPVKEIFGPDA